MTLSDETDAPREADSKQYDDSKRLLHRAETSGFGNDTSRDLIAAANVHALLALRDAILFMDS